MPPPFGEWDRTGVGELPAVGQLLAPEAARGGTVLYYNCRTHFKSTGRNNRASVGTVAVCLDKCAHAFLLRFRHLLGTTYKKRCYVEAVGPTVDAGMSSFKADLKNLS